MAERGRGYCGGRGGGRREDPLDDEGQHQRDLRDVKNDDLRREVRALRRRIARLEASRDRDFNFVVHYEDDDKNDNPFARAGGERRFRHRVADPGRDFGVRLEIPEFTGKVLPVVGIEGPPVYDEYPDEGVESEFEVVLETVDDNNFTTEVKYASLKSLNICRLGNETGDNLSYVVEAVRIASEHSDNFSPKLFDVVELNELTVCSNIGANAKCAISLHSCFHSFEVQVENMLPLVKREITFDNDYIKTESSGDILQIFYSRQFVNANLVFLQVNRRAFKLASFCYISNGEKIKTRGRVFPNKGSMMQFLKGYDCNK
ncbi:hypothetical protein CASFOL_019114 [Castilleja foliolosa]|uniref:Uncharacterized protein n=1 Tax=Castilleja foliolosa TaxID=1961234 RepID=A0ABD3D3G7_9LAMI